MEAYERDVVQYFFDHQGQLFDQNVADSLEEAREFLEDCMAVVCKNIREVRQYFDESGMDISGMNDFEINEADEVFALPDGRFLIVEA